MPAKTPALVENILPANRVHILGGPSGAGKTTWVMQFLREWTAGGDVLGHKSHPIPVAYVSADRDTDEVHERMDAIGVDRGAFPVINCLDKQYQVEQIPEMVESVLGVGCEQNKLIVIEGLARFVPDCNLRSYGVVADFLVRLQQMCKTRNITILATIHTAKTKSNERYDNPREKLLGSVAWGAYSSTILVLLRDHVENVKDRGRTLIILPRNHEESEIHLEMTSGGRLIEMLEGADTKEFNFYAVLEPGVEYSRQDLVDRAGRMFQLSPAWVDRMLKTFTVAGKLVKPQAGVYVRPLIQLPLQKSLVS